MWVITVCVKARLKLYDVANKYDINKTYISQTEYHTDMYSHSAVY